MNRTGARTALASAAAITLTALFLSLAGCASRQPPAASHPPAPPDDATRLEGLASWYGRKFHGRPTASGERYDMHELTAAHRTLPFETRVRVTNLENGRSVRVRINDRGPFVDGRIIDLSYGAAKKLGMVEAGVVRVRLEILDG
jgi:rare lipoprotein A